MIRRQKKKCRKCKKPSFLFSKGLCYSCYSLEKVKQKKNVKDTKYKIPRVSEKEKARKRAYKELRYIYLRDHPICEVEDCSHKAIEIHHKAGRVGDALYNHFLAVCENCHKRIEENPIWAKENNYSITRINDSND
jgi:hypothetical protein